jgi:DNA-binding response OmpR family regulator
MTRRVLIAEDEPSIAVSLEFLMRRAGFETRTARDGEEALAILSSFRPDLALLDIMLPGCSGLDLCRVIRSDPRLTDTRIIVLTARGGENDIRRGFEAGADAYVVKPFSTQELVERVKGLLACAAVQPAMDAAREKR